LIRIPLWPKFPQRAVQLRTRTQVRVRRFAPAPTRCFKEGHDASCCTMLSQRAISQFCRLHPLDRPCDVVSTPNIKSGMQHH
jgi:hypothetical protein